MGYGLYDAGVEGYGEMREDHKLDNGSDDAGFFTKGRGHVEINITGGTIGNNYEFIVPTTGFESWTAEQWTTWKNNNYVPNTTYDTSNGRVLHTKGGNIYAGGMGRYYQLDGSTPISSYNGSGELTPANSIEWTKLGNVKSTKVTISGEPWIMGDVYGGGEMGSVTGTHNVLDDSGNPVKVDDKNVVTGTEIIIKGGTIGTEITGETPVKTTVSVPEGYPGSGGNSSVIYTYGSVYGGGEGREEHDASKNQDHGGKVVNDVRVDISGTTKVRASVFGGGELAYVGGDTYVNISGGEIGRNEVKSKDSDNPGYVKFGGATMGNVYGGGKGQC